MCTPLAYTPIHFVPLTLYLRTLLINLIDQEHSVERSIDYAACLLAMSYNAVSRIIVYVNQHPSMASILLRTGR